jgi:hypothetical protein
MRPRPPHPGRAVVYGTPAGLPLAEPTGKAHVTRMLAKLGLRDRAQAVVYAYESGLIQPGPS